MTVDQVIEKIKLNPPWAAQVYKDLPEAPPRERATFGLAMRSYQLLAMDLNSKNHRNNSIPDSRSILLYYAREDATLVLSEIAGETDLTENMQYYIKNGGLPGEELIRSDPTDLISQVQAAKASFKTGTAWPEGLTDKIIQSGTPSELGALLSHAPLTRSEVLSILSKALASGENWLVRDTYVHPLMPWSEVEKALRANPLNTYIARSASRRYDLTDEALQQLMSLGDDMTFYYLAKNHGARLKDEHYQAMLDLPAALHPKKFLASSTSTPHWVLLGLAKDSNLVIQMELAARHDLPKDLTEQMRKVSEYLNSSHIEQKLQTNQELSKEEIRQGLTSDYKSIRVSTITKAVGKKR